MGEIVDGLLSRQNHATLLRSIKIDKLFGVVSKLPNVTPSEVPDTKDTSVSEEVEEPKKKFEMPQFSSGSEKSVSSGNIDDLLGMTKKPQVKANILDTTDDEKSELDNLLGLGKPVENSEEVKPVNDNIDDLLGMTKKEHNKTNFSFLDSDEDDFKPIPTVDENEASERSRASTPSAEKDSSVASWLKSTSEEKTATKPAETENYDEDFSDKSSTLSESSLEEQILEENPYLANLQASARASARQHSSDSESVVSFFSVWKDKKVF